MDAERTLGRDAVVCRPLRPRLRSIFGGKIDEHLGPAAGVRRLHMEKIDPDTFRCAIEYLMAHKKPYYRMLYAIWMVRNADTGPDPFFDDL